MSVPVWIVVAAAENGVIGMDGDMPWRLSTDLKRFKALTLGKPMIMGRKTFESIGKPLPGRTSIVVTRDKEWQSPGVVVASSTQQALLVAQEVALAEQADAVCVVGGGQIYAQTIELADVLHVTKVSAQPKGDTVFPDIDLDIWEEIECEDVPAGERDSAATRYCIYQRHG
jgi:dihydrofolate reductase